MRKFFVVLIFLVGLMFFSYETIYAQSKINRITPTISGSENDATTSSDAATASSTMIQNPEPSPIVRPDLTQKTEETVEPLKKLLYEQTLGPFFPTNPLKYAIRESVSAGVPPNTIVLLLLLPAVALLIAATRHLVGLRGFGILLPAALSVTFVAMGPIVGIGLFLVIVFTSTLVRITLRKIKIKLQYLPRMALMLHFVVFAILVILFLAPFVKWPDFANISIFPVLFLVLLAEDFSKVQLGKSAKVAIQLTSETLILALLSYFFMTLKGVQKFALLKPEIWFLLIITLDILLGKYAGLRFLELLRFRKLIIKNK